MDVRLYGVSYGNGNDSVSHMYPDYYVATDDPRRLAKAAMVSMFDAGEGQAWAIENMEVDGEAEYTISATIYNPPEDDGDFEATCEDAARRANGAWKIVEVFLVDAEDRDVEKRNFDSSEHAFGADLLALVGEK